MKPTESAGSAMIHATLFTSVNYHGIGVLAGWWGSKLQAMSRLELCSGRGLLYADQ